MAIINTPLLGLPYAGADTDETYAVLAGLFVKDGKKLTLPEIVEKYTPTVGTVYIKAADWTAADGTEDAYDAKIKINGVEAESVILIYPLSSANAEKAKRLGIRAKTLSGSANDDTFVIVRATGGAPTVADGISLAYIAFRGYPVWNEGLTPPAMPYATVIGVDPYIATEEGDRDDIAASQRLVTEAVTALRSYLSSLSTGLADTNKALELRLKSADLQTKLDEYRAAKGLIDKTVSDLLYYYNKSQTLTKEEINALVSAIPKFKIEVVTSLPTSNISDTTVYLVKSGDDDTNLYTEYIRPRGKWEKLGTQTVDLTGYATEAWVNDILAAYVKTVDMEAYVTGLLAGYLNKEDADALYADKKTTETALTENREKIAELEEALENATVEFAPSIDWLSENGDTSKKYYLPDGYEYTYHQKPVAVKHEANTKNSAGLNKIASGNTMTPIPYNGIYTIDAVEVDKSWDSCKVTISGLDQLVCVYFDALWIYFFDESGTKLADVSSYALGNRPEKSPVNLPYEVDLAKIQGGWENYPFPITASKYVMMSMGIKAGGIELSDIKNLSVNFAPLDRTENVWGWYSTGVQHSNDQATQKNSEDIAALDVRTTALEKEVEDLQKTVENDGMTYEPTREVLYAIGDSITYGTGVGGNINAWPTHLMDIMGYDTENSRNLGISGIGFCTPVLDRTVRDVVDERDFSVADVVTVAIGVNDWKNGSVTVENFFAEMEYCLGKIRSDNPYCKIFYILPFNFLPKDSVFETFWALGYKLPGTSTDYCFGNTLQEFVNLIKEKFEEEPLKSLNVHVFDMTKSPITRYNIETALFGGDDGIHPTAETHKVLAREIARRISNA